MMRFPWRVLHEMMIILALVSVGYFGAELIYQAALHVAEERDNDLANVWIVELEDEYGSGFPVESIEREDGTFDVYFLTAKHVVESPVVQDGQLYHRGNELDFEVVGVHPDHDVALLVANSPVHVRPRVLGTAQFGDVLIAAGYADAEYFRLTIGIAAEPGEMSCIIYGGMSGGPVTRLDGAVVGIQTAYVMWGFGLHVDRWRAVSFYTTIEDIEPWLREALAR